jgi:hypothetical protein
MSDRQPRRIEPSAEAADLAERILQERDKLADLAWACTDEQWESAPLGAEDPRRVLVIVDHVADSYEYLAGWVQDLLDGSNPEVNGELVDALNADHAARVEMLTRSDVTAHLVRSGDEMASLLRGLTDEQLALSDGRVARLAAIAARHADNHRREIAAALGIELAIIDDEAAE